jgi:hypothetical protein
MFLVNLGVRTYDYLESVEPTEKNILRGHHDNWQKSRVRRGEDSARFEVLEKRKRSGSFGPVRAQRRDNGET